MPPRPRPKPRKKVAADLSPSEPGPSSLSPGASAKPAAKAVVVDDEDDDDEEYFFKNRNRSSAAWKKLEKVTRDSPKRTNLGSGDEGEDNVETSPRKRHKHKSKDGVPSVPDWNERLRLLSDEVQVKNNGGSDSEVEVGDHTNGSQSQSNGKNKRRRSRSRSITPPPEMSEVQRASLHQIVRTALNHDTKDSANANASFGLDLDEEEEAGLDPELLKIINNVKSNPVHSNRASNSNPRKGLSRETSMDPYEDQQGSLEEITLSVKWIPHPMKPEGKTDECVVTMNRSDDFHDLFDEVADRFETLAGSLVITSNRQRVFPSGTPFALGLRFSANLEAYDKATYDYIRANRAKSPLPGSNPTSPSTGTRVSSNRNGTLGNPTPRSTSSSPSRAKNSSSGTTMKLVLRSAKAPGKDVTLTVRTTTTCGAVVQAFAKAAGLVGVKGVNVAKGCISIDGDKVGNDVEIGDADVEDGDMVEVVGF